MSVQLTSEQVWQEIEKNFFAVLGMVTAKEEARTVGINYVVDNQKLYIDTLKEAWKTKHIVANPHVSLTVPIAKRVPFMPWLKIPPDTTALAFTKRVRVAHPLWRDGPDASQGV
jgi:hypothetical protein